MNPNISVIIPTYNRLAALAELLECLSRQSYRDFEAIIVNDGGEPIDEVIALYPELRIKSLRTETNARHVLARNMALTAAEGDWIMPCDDDDLLLPSHMERMLRESADADLLYSDVEIVDFAWNEEGTMRLPRTRRLFAYRYDRQGMREFSTFVPSGSMYRRSIHAEIGEFDPAMYHYWDWDFMLRVSEQYRVKRVPAAGVLYAFTEEGGNLSDDLADMRMYLVRLCAKHGLGELPTKNFFLLLEEPGVKSRETGSEIVWDGLPVRSRWLRATNSASRTGSAQTP